MRDIEPKTRQEAEQISTWHATIPAGAVVAYAVAALFNSGLTVAKELVPGIKAAMAAAAGHHWPAQAILNAMIFAAVWIALRKKRELANAPMWIVGSTVLSATIIIGFYLLHWWGH